jgi:hypothetical protein
MQGGRKCCSTKAPLQGTKAKKEAQRRRERRESEEKRKKVEEEEDKRRKREEGKGKRDGWRKGTLVWFRLAKSAVAWWCRYGYEGQEGCTLISYMGGMGGKHSIFVQLVSITSQNFGGHCGSKTHTTRHIFTFCHMSS